MPLRHFMTATASTQREPTRVGSKFGDLVTHLENVKIIPLMLTGLSDHPGIRQAVGLEGTAVALFETYTESHEHVDGGVTVTQLPDIVEGDLLITNSKTYKVVFAQPNAATSGFGETRILYLTESKRLT